MLLHMFLGQSLMLYAFTYIHEQQTGLSNGYPLPAIRKWQPLYFYSSMAPLRFREGFLPL